MQRNAIQSYNLLLIVAQNPLSQNVLQNHFRKLQKALQQSEQHLQDKKYSQHIDKASQTASATGITQYLIIINMIIQGEQMIINRNLHKFIQASSLSSSNPIQYICLFFSF